MYIESLSVLSLDCVCIECFEPALNLYGFCVESVLNLELNLDGICIGSVLNLCCICIESVLYGICIESVLHLY